MKDLVEAIKSNDLVATRKVFFEAMAQKSTDVINEHKLEIARSFLIEGEEHVEDVDDEDDDDDDEEDE